MVIAKKLGSLYVDGAPTHPTAFAGKNYDVDFPFDGPVPQLELGDAVSKMGLFFLPLGRSFICSEPIAPNTSWSELNSQGLIDGKEFLIDGHKYLCRTMSLEEWFEALTGYGKASPPCWCPGEAWTKDVPKGNSLQRIVCGGLKPESYIPRMASSKMLSVGYRPILKPLEPVEVSHTDKGKYIRFWGNGGSVAGTLEEVGDYDYIIRLGQQPAKAAKVARAERKISDLSWATIWNTNFAAVDKTAIIWADAE